MRITNRKINAMLTISHRFVAIKKEGKGESEQWSNRGHIVDTTDTCVPLAVIVFRFIYAIHKLKNKAEEVSFVRLATMFGRQTSGGTILQRTTPYRVPLST